MVKYILIAIYLLFVIIFYRLSEQGVEAAKKRYNPANTHMSQQAWDVTCDLVYIAYCFIWPVLLMRIIFSKKRKKE